MHRRKDMDRTEQEKKSGTSEISKTKQETNRNKEEKTHYKIPP